MKNEGIRKSAIAGILTILSARICGIGGKIIIVAILARVLAPADFGIFSAAMLVLGFLEIIAFVGLGPSIVQRKNLEERHLKTGLSVSLALGSSLALLIVIAAKPFAQFVGISQVAGPLIVSAPFIVIKSYSIISNSLLRRNLEFKKLAQIQLNSFFFGFALFSLFGAWLKLGFWALFLGFFAQVLIVSFLTVIFSKKIIRPSFDKLSFKEMFHFSLGVSLSRLANYIAQKGDYFVVSKFLGAEPLGFYNRAYTVMEVPVKSVVSSIDQVLFPVFSRNRHSKKLADTVISMTSLNFIIYGAIGMGMYCLAPDIITLLLGKNWGDVIPILQILCLGMPFRSAYKFPNSAVRANGHSYGLFVLQAIYAITVTVGAWVGSYEGLSGVSWGVLSALIINFFVCWAYCARTIGMRQSQGLFSFFSSLPMILLIYFVASNCRSILLSYEVGQLILLGVTITSLLLIAIFMVVVFPKLFLGRRSMDATNQVLNHSVFGRKILRILINKVPGWAKFNI